MRVAVQKWGNSLALRIPKSFAIDSKIANGSSVDLSLVEGKIIVSPATSKQYALKELLAGVSKKNIHQEVNMGEASGKEVR
jgi:antitoxin MazE